MPADPSPPKSDAIPTKDILHAPVIYFDGASNYGCNQGIVNFTLAMGRHLANASGGVDFDIIAVAHARCSIPAAIDLRNALDKAILIGTPAAGGEQAN
jgi:hypothetical protein